MAIKKSFNRYLGLKRKKLQLGGFVNPEQDKEDQKDAAINQVGTTAVSAIPGIGPALGAVAGVATGISSSVKKDHSDATRNSIGTALDPFNWAKGNENAGDWAQSILNPIGSFMTKGQREKDRYDRAKKTAMDKSFANSLQASQSILANYDTNGTHIKSLAEGGRLVPYINEKTGDMISWPGGYQLDSLKFKSGKNSFANDKYKEGGKIPVFVYGTLKNPNTLKKVIHEVPKETSASIKAKLSDYGDGYRDIQPGNSTVKGKLFKVTPEENRELQTYEKDYKEVPVHTSKGDAKAFNYKSTPAPKYNMGGKVYAQGGELRPIGKSGSYEVKGDEPHKTDDVLINNGQAAVDHDEVVKPAHDGLRIYSDHLKVPGLGKSYSDVAKSLEKQKSKNPKFNKQNRFIEKKLSDLFNLQQIHNGDNNGESPEEGLHPHGEVSGKGFETGNMFKLGGGISPTQNIVSPVSRYYHKITPEAIGMNPGNYLGSKLMSRSGQEVNSEAMYKNRVNFDIKGRYQTGGTVRFPRVSWSSLLKKNNNGVLPSSLPSGSPLSDTIRMGNMYKMTPAEMNRFYNLPIGNQDPNDRSTVIQVNAGDPNLLFGNPGFTAKRPVTRHDDWGNELELGGRIEYEKPLPLNFPIGYTENKAPSTFKDGGIHIKPSHKGRFTAYLKRTGSTLQQALHSKNPHVRQMANFARNAKKWHHEDGGLVDSYQSGGKFNWGEMASSAAALAPSLANLFAASKVPYPGDVHLNNAIRLQRINGADQLSKLDQGLRTAYLASRNSANPNAQQAAIGNAQATYGNQVNDLYGEINRTNTGIGNQETLYNSQIQGINNEKLDNLSRALQARQANILGLQSQSRADLSNKVLGLMAQSNQKKKDAQEYRMFKMYLDKRYPGGPEGKDFSERQYWLDPDAVNPDQPIKRLLGGKLGNNVLGNYLPVKDIKIDSEGPMNTSKAPNMPTQRKSIANKLSHLKRLQKNSVKTPKRFSLGR